MRTPKTAPADIANRVLVEIMTFSSTKPLLVNNARFVKNEQRWLPLGCFVARAGNVSRWGQTGGLAPSTMIGSRRCEARECLVTGQLGELNEVAAGVVQH